MGVLKCNSGDWTRLEPVLKQKLPNNRQFLPFSSSQMIMGSKKEKGKIYCFVVLNRVTFRIGVVVIVEQILS